MVRRRLEKSVWPSIGAGPKLEEREVKLADGSRATYPYVGPIELRFKNRVGYLGALVLGDEVLLGAIPLEDMDLIVDLRNRSVDVNAESPNIGSGLCKRVARRRRRAACGAARYSPRSLPPVNS